MFYLDSSAALKLVVAEAESDALRAYMSTSDAWAISEIGRIEVLRGAARRAVGAGARVLLAQALFVDITADVIDTAAALDPPTLRTLDAIHVASALSIRDAIDGLITYDTRIREAAERHGLNVVSPGA